MIEYNDNIIIIDLKGQVKQIIYSEIQKDKVKFYIHSKFIKSTYTSKNSYFQHIVYCADSTQAIDNTFEWKAIKCKVIELENWDIDDVPKKNNLNKMVLKAEITDYNKALKIINFDNQTHNGKGFKHLFHYLNYLSVVKTHNKVSEILEGKKNIKF